MQGFQSYQREDNDHELNPNSDTSFTVVETHVPSSAGSTQRLRPSIFRIFAVGFGIGFAGLLLLFSTGGGGFVSTSTLSVAPTGQGARVVLEEDKDMSVIVGQCQPLLYTSGERKDIDRPAYLRAASSMQWVYYSSISLAWDDKEGGNRGDEREVDVGPIVGVGRLAVMQDDMGFIGLLDVRVTDGAVVSIERALSVALPSAKGARQFQSDRGNKHLKLDLEASIYIPKNIFGDAEWPKGQSQNSAVSVGEGVLLAFGSGSLAGTRDIIFVLTQEVLSSQNDVDRGYVAVNRSWWKEYQGDSWVANDHRDTSVHVPVATSFPSPPPTYFSPPDEDPPKNPATTLPPSPAFITNAALPPYDPFSSGIFAFHAPGLFAKLRSTTAFSGSELNLEGATLIPPIYAPSSPASADVGADTHTQNSHESRHVHSPARIRLFQRGNGKADPKRGLAPQSATGELVLEELLVYLDSLLVADGYPTFFQTSSPTPVASPPVSSAQVPSLSEITVFDLGHVGGTPLTFTGSAPAHLSSLVPLSSHQPTVSTIPLHPSLSHPFQPSTVHAVTPALQVAASSHTTLFVYIAGAEASPDATKDGEVLGTALGLVQVAHHHPSSSTIERREEGRFTFMRTLDGSKFVHKTEGVCLANPLGGLVGIGQHKEVTVLTVLDMDDSSVPSQICTVVIKLGAT